MGSFPNLEVPLDIDTIALRYAASCGCDISDDINPALRTGKQRLLELAKHERPVTLTVGTLLHLGFSVLANTVVRDGYIDRPLREHFESAAHNQMLQGMYDSITRRPLPEQLQASLDDHLDDCRIKLARIEDGRAEVYTLRGTVRAPATDAFGVVDGPGWYTVHARQEDGYWPVRRLQPGEELFTVLRT